jgi:hypothetical protein
MWELNTMYAWVYKLRFLVLFLTEGNYTERECRREVGAFGVMTNLLLWKDLPGLSHGKVDPSGLSCS